MTTAVVRYPLTAKTGVTGGLVLELVLILIVGTGNVNSIRYVPGTYIPVCIKNVTGKHTPGINSPVVILICSSNENQIRCVNILLLILCCRGIHAFGGPSWIMITLLYYYISRILFFNVFPYH